MCPASRCDSVALKLAQNKLVTFGITPDEPATGFGYIERGAALEAADGYSVTRFVEKPNLRRPGNFWQPVHFSNSGMFVFKAATYLSELQRYRPDIFRRRNSPATQHARPGFLPPDEVSFAPARLINRLW